jgi:hypothetical protein
LDEDLYIKVARLYESEDFVVDMFFYLKSFSGTKSSISDGGRVWSSWQRIRWDVAPPNFDGKHPVMEVGSSCAKSASQKPYSSSPGAWSQGRGFWRLDLLIAGTRRCSRWRSYDGGTVASVKRALCPTLPQKAERACICGLPFSPHTILEEVEMTSKFKYRYLYFTKQGGTKEFPLLWSSLHIWMDLLDFTGNFRISYLAPSTYIPIDSSLYTQHV